MSAIYSSEQPTIHATILGKTVLALNRSCDQCNFTDCTKLHLAGQDTICIGAPQRDKLNDPAYAVFKNTRACRSLMLQFGENATVRDIIQYGYKKFKRIPNVGAVTLNTIDNILEQEYNIKDWYKT